MNVLKIAAMAGLIGLLSACSNVSAYRIGQPAIIIDDPGLPSDGGGFSSAGGNGGGGGGGGATSAPPTTSKY